MKKRLLTLMLALPVAFIAQAQKAEYAKAVVHYKFSHIRDTAAKDKPYTENMVLFLGQTSSVYKSFDKKTQDALMKKQIAEQMAEQKGSGSMHIKVTNTKPTTRTEYYQFTVQNKLVRKETLITPYMIEEPMPVIKWKISSDTASFGTLHCQKATGHFKGRDYTAWFCPDVPFHTGPWKLNGLPGLIVEAYDTNKEVQFKFDGMDEVAPAGDKPAATASDVPASASSGMVVKLAGMDEDTSDPNIIALPADAVKTNEKDFANLQAAMKKDPQAFMAAMGGGAANATFRAAPGMSAPTGGVNRVMVNGTGPVINNPLELPEKK